MNTPIKLMLALGLICMTSIDAFARHVVDYYKLTISLKVP